MGEIHCLQLWVWRDGIWSPPAEGDLIATVAMIHHGPQLSSTGASAEFEWCLLGNKPIMCMGPEEVKAE